MPPRSLGWGAVAEMKAATAIAISSRTSTTVRPVAARMAFGPEIHGRLPGSSAPRPRQWRLHSGVPAA